MQPWLPAPPGGCILHRMLPATLGMSPFSRQLLGPAAPPGRGGHRVALPALISHKGSGKTAISCPGELRSRRDTAIGEQSAQGNSGQSELPLVGTVQRSQGNGMAFMTGALLRCVCSTPKPSHSTPSWGQWQASLGHILPPISTCRDKTPCSALFRFPFGRCSGTGMPPFPCDSRDRSGLESHPPRTPPVYSVPNESASSLSNIPQGKTAESAETTTPARVFERGAVPSPRSV